MWPPWLQACKLACNLIACLTWLLIWVLPLLMGCVVNVEKGMSGSQAIPNSSCMGRGANPIGLSAIQKFCTGGSYDMCKLRSVHSPHSHIWIQHFLDRNMGVLLCVGTMAQAETPLLWLSLCWGVLHPACKGPVYLSILLSWFCRSPQKSFLPKGIGRVGRCGEKTNRALNVGTCMKLLD